MITYEVHLNDSKMLETSELDVATEAVRAWANRQHTVRLYEITTKELKV